MWPGSAGSEVFLDMWPFLFDNAAGSTVQVTLSPLNLRIKCQDVNSHGVVEVADDARRLAWRGVPEAGVVGIAEDALEPGQRAGRRHGLVGKMTYRVKQHRK